MSLFGGVYSLCGRPPQPAWRSTILRALGRSGDVADTWSDEHLFLAKVNVGALDALGLHRATGDRITALAGDPLHAVDASGITERERSVGALSEGLSRDVFATLRRCRGSFCLAHYDARAARLVLATDHCGVRPIFHHIGPDYVFFATAEHVLTAIREVPKEMDTLAVAQQATMGFPLADRTPYAAIKVTTAAEVLSCTPEGVDSSRYFAWAEVAPRPEALDLLLDEAYDQFLTGLRCRSVREDRAVAFLSGGLDSRCVTAGLTLLGKDVTSVTFHRPGFQDTAFAEQFAAACGVTHIVQEVPAGEPQWVSKGRAARRIAWGEGPRPEHPRICFSGDGGSVGIGHAHIEATHMDAVRAGDLDELAQRVPGVRPSRVPFRRTAYRTLSEAMFRAVREELDFANGAAPERVFYFFLMNNDQRRHLFDQFENIDRYRSELMLPLYDAELLKLLAASPIEAGLRHGSYYEWLKRFPGEVSSIPWQAYPGHLPCPVETAAPPGALRAQWDKSASERFDEALPLYRQCRRVLLDSFSSRFPSRLLSRPRCAAALLLHGLRIRNCSTILRTIVLLQAGHAQSEGKRAATGDR